MFADKRLLGASFGIILLSLTAAAQDPTLHRVHKLDLVVAGSSDKTQHFRDLLRDQLRRVGFEVTERPADADVTLRAEFSAESHVGSSSADASLSIKNHGGRLIWSGSYYSAHRGEGPDRTIEDLAQTCAERLRMDWEKSGK